MKLKYHLLPSILSVLLLLISGFLPGSKLLSEPESPRQNPSESSFTPPCEVITIETIIRVFNLDDIEIEAEAKDDSYPTCKYTWKGMNKRSMDVGGQQTVIDIESMVMIIMVDFKVGKSAFDAAKKSYTDELEDVEIGDNAVWSNKRRQITVLADKNLFHVKVNFTTDNDKNKEKAIELSQIIIDSF